MAFANDVFISYAHVDNQPLDPTRAGQSAGWVTTLVHYLEHYLEQEIGRAEGFTVWKDKYNLRSERGLAGGNWVNTQNHLNERDQWLVAADPKLTPGAALILILLFSVGLWCASWPLHCCDHSIDRP
jgi:hypothetical protein